MLYTYLDCLTSWQFDTFVEVPILCRRFLEIVEPGNICQKMVEALSRGLSCLKVSKVLYILSSQVTAIKY